VNLQPNLSFDDSPFSQGGVFMPFVDFSLDANIIFALHIISLMFPVAEIRDTLSWSYENNSWTLFRGLGHTPNVANVKNIPVPDSKSTLFGYEPFLGWITYSYVFESTLI